MNVKFLTYCTSCLFFHLLLNFIGLKALINTLVILKTFFTWRKWMSNLCNEWIKCITIWKINLNSAVLPGAGIGVTVTKPWLQSWSQWLCVSVQLCCRLLAGRPEVGSWPTRCKSGKINSEWKSREHWTLICVGRGQWSFNVLCFLFIPTTSGDLGELYRRGEWRTGEVRSRGQMTHQRLPSRMRHGTRVFWVHPSLLAKLPQLEQSNQACFCHGSPYPWAPAVLFFPLCSSQTSEGSGSPPIDISRLLVRPGFAEEGT